MIVYMYEVSIPEGDGTELIFGIEIESDMDSIFVAKTLLKGKESFSANVDTLEEIDKSRILQIIAVGEIDLT